MHQILQVMNSRMLMSFSFPCLMGFMKQCRMIRGRAQVQVNLFVPIQCLLVAIFSPPSPKIPVFHSCIFVAYSVVCIFELDMSSCLYMMLIRLF